LRWRLAVQNQKSVMPGTPGPCWRLFNYYNLHKRRYAWIASGTASLPLASRERAYLTYGWLRYCPGRSAPPPAPRSRSARPDRTRHPRPRRAARAGGCSRATQTLRLRLERACYSRAFGTDTYLTHAGHAGHTQAGSVPPRR